MLIRGGERKINGGRLWEGGTPPGVPEKQRKEEKNDAQKIASVVSGG